MNARLADQRGGLARIAAISGDVARADDTVAGYAAPSGLGKNGLNRLQIAVGPAENEKRQRQGT